uniref:Ras family GTPase n=1 Tax=Mimivirus LCMiAC02 TaxID=2506609 RepID=A0A4P6VLV6_9VIRU|nr:MAG: Ras family GTPase [Mimivirus LCMiAC02]
MSNTDNQQEIKSYKLKYIIVGMAGVGKSSLGEYYVHRKTATSEKNITVYIEFFSKQIKIKNKDLNIQIWDTAGQERYSDVVKCYYRDPVGVFICFSLIDRNSFDKLFSYYETVQSINDRNANFTLVGTFLDKPNERCVSKEEAENFAKKYNMKYIETSSKTGENIDECFETMNNIMCDRIDNFDSYIICSNDGYHDDLDNIEENRMLLYKCCKQ